MRRKTARKPSGNLARLKLEAPRLPRYRHGYSLGELLIVLAILTALAGLSWPSVRGSLSKSRLQDSARQVRTELAKTRLKAIRTGVPHRFRFQLDGSQFEVGPQTPPLQSLEVPQPFANQTGVDRADDVRSESESASASPIANVATHSLLTGVRFAGFVSARLMPVVSSSRATSEQNAVLSRDYDENDADDEFSSVLWSSPIIFYPNGRTRNAKIRLLGERGFQIDVTLRGLTGTATVGELSRPVDVDHTNSPESDEDAL